MVINVDEAEILDLIRSSNFKKFACRLRPESGHYSDRQMFRTSIVYVRPDLNHDLHQSQGKEDARVNFSLLPVRLNIDQDTFEFIGNFFSSDTTPTAEQLESLLMSSASDDDDSSDDDEADDDDDDGDDERIPRGRGRGGGAAAAADRAAAAGAVVAPVYIQSFRVDMIPVCIDYKPKHMDYQAFVNGDYLQGLHFWPLQDVELALKSFECHGVEGWGAAFGKLVSFWTGDIGQHQLHHVAAGAQPIRSFCKIGSGMADLVLIPIEQFKKDGRLLRGLSKGGSSFGRALALETLQLGNDVANASQSLLEGIDGAVSGLSRDAQTRSSQRLRQRTSRHRGKVEEEAATICFF